MGFENKFVTIPKKDYEEAMRLLDFLRFAGDFDSAIEVKTVIYLLTVKKEDETAKEG